MFKWFLYNFIQMRLMSFVQSAERLAIRHFICRMFAREIQIGRENAPTLRRLPSKQESVRFLKFRLCG